MDSKIRASAKKPIPNTLKIGIILVVAFVGGWLGARSYLANSSSLVPQKDEAKQTVINQSELISSIAKDVGQSVVSINVTSRTRTIDPIFGTNQVQESESAGTGFIISSDGYIVTNRHVLPEGQGVVEVVMSDGTVFQNVKVIGKTPSSDSLDVAFLKIQDLKGKKVKPVDLGNSSDMRVGDMAIAIGNALGQFQNSVTSGIISGYGRSVQAEGDGGNVETLQNLFQTDAAINQGNSGGPLVNADGQVIGINTAVAGGGAENIGFAIPINDVTGLVRSVLEDGALRRPYLGVRYVQLNPQINKELELNETQEGAYILSSDNGSAIVSGSPADEAGLQEKDIIIKINDQDVNQKNPLTSVVGRFKVGDEVSVTYVRNGKQQQTKLVLDQLK
jgi:serine protease Do